MLFLPGNAHASTASSCSGPNTSHSTGAVRRFTSLGSASCMAGMSGLGCQSPKYCSMMSTTSSGSKSPLMHIATLFGTYHLLKCSLIVVIDGFLRCSCEPSTVCCPYGWLGNNMLLAAFNTLRISRVRLMLYSSYTASSSVWNPRITMSLKRLDCIFAQFSTSFDGMSSV